MAVFVIPAEVVGAQLMPHLGDANDHAGNNDGGSDNGEAGNNDGGSDDATSKPRRRFRKAVLAAVACSRLKMLRLSDSEYEQMIKYFQVRWRQWRACSIPM